MYHGTRYHPPFRPDIERRLTVQILLPVPDMVDSASMLKSTDIPCQIKDILQALGVMHQSVAGHEEWVTHPVVRQWHGYDMHLAN